MNIDSTYTVFVGIDWGNSTHAVCIVDAAGAVAKTRTFEHSGRGLASLVDTLLEAAGGEIETLCVVVELTRGPVVETLLERGIHVYVCTPKQTDRFRDRFSAARAKDDPLDARILASVGRTDLHLLRRVVIDPADALFLREHSRLLESLNVDFTRHTNRLRDLLLRVFPAVLTLCPAADERWLWALLLEAPTPAQAARLRVAKLEKLLARYRIRRVTGAELKAALAEPPVRVAPGVSEATAAHIAVLIPLLRALQEQRERVERMLAKRLAAMEEPGAAAPAPQREAHEEETPKDPPSPGSGAAPQEPAQRTTPSERPSDAAILRSLPGVGMAVLAALLGEHAEAIRLRDLDRVRGESGTAPVTKRSGQQHVVVMRRACNKRLRGLLHMMALNAIRMDEASRAYYARGRARGHSAARALRGVSDRMLRIAFAMLRNGTLYDPTRQRAQTALPASEVTT